MKLPKMYPWGWLLAISITLSACSDHNDPPPPPPASNGSATIDSRGGTVDGPDGVQLLIPPGALNQEVTIRIARSNSGAPALPAALTSDLPVYEITPHNLSFSHPVTIRLPLSGTADEGTAVFVTEAGGEWQSTPVTIADGYALVERVSLSWYVLVPNLHSRPCILSINDDPYPCVWPVVSLGGDIAVSPPEAAPDGGRFPTIVLPAELSFPVRVSTPRDCVNGVLTVYQDTRPATTPATAPRAWQRLLEQPITLTPQPNTNHRSEGSFLFTTQVNAGENSGFGLRFAFSCRRTYNNYTYSAFMETLYRADVPQQPGTPSISQQPQSLTVLEGNNASFNINATAPDTLTIQWQRSNDSGATWSNVANGNNYSLAPAQLTDNGAWIRASVCNTAGVSSNCIYSNVATLTVTSTTIAPLFTQHPSSQSVVAGQTASFTAVASGVPAPALQWYKSGTPDQAVGAPCPPGIGTTSCTYTTGALTLGDSGSHYYASASNSAGTVQSNHATLTVTAGAMGPAIDVNTPADVTVTEGGTALFSVQATGTAPLSYQWYRDGNLIPGANASTYSIGNVQAADDGATFAVEVTNGASTATSRSARLSVNVGHGSSLGNWAILQPSPHANHLMALEITGSDIYTAGPRTLMHSADGGSIWTTHFNDLDGIVALAAPSSGVLVVASNGNVADGIYRSTDGGQSWSQQAPGLEGNALAFGDALTGLMVDGVGDVYHTADGGITWSGTGANVAGGKKLTAIDADTYLALGSGGAILRSSDGGASWVTAFNANGAYELTDVQFANATLGIAVGGATMLRTTDGGLSWSSVTGVSDYFVSVAFADDTTAVAFSNVGVIYRSTDGGLHWTGVQNWAGAEINQVRFADSNTGYAVGLNGQTLRTTDGGNYWAAIAGGSNLDNLYSVDVSPGGTILAAGVFSMFRSNDSGMNWQFVTTGTYTRSAAFASDNVAVGVGYNRTIWRSADGGVNWNSVMQDTSGLFDVDFASATTGVIVGEAGRILRTSDGGQSWQPVNSGVTNDLTTVRFLSSTSGYAGGSHSTLLRTSDGGASWSPVNLPETFQANIFVREITSTASGSILVLNDIRVWRSSDGGSSWSAIVDLTQGAPCSSPLRGVSFTDANHGIVVGDHCITRTTDGGSNWTWLDLPVTTNLNAVAAINSDTFVVVGDGALIMRNNQDGAP